MAATKKYRNYGSGSLFKVPNSPYWQAAFYVSGKRYVRSTKCTNKREAEAVLTALVNKVNENDQKAPPELIGYTFREISQRWLDSKIRSNLRADSKAQKRIIVENHLIPYFGNRKISSIIPDDLDKFVKAKFNGGFEDGSPCPVAGGASQKPLSISSVGKQIVALKAIFRFAQTNHWLTSSRPNPAEDLTTRDLEEIGKSRTKRALEKSEVKKLLEAADNSDEKWQSLYVRLMVELGLRIGEASALSADCFDKKTKTLTIDRTVSTNPDFTGKIERLKPISEELDRETFSEITNGRTKTEAGRRELVVSDEMAKLIVAQIESEERKKRLSRAKEPGDFLFPTKRGLFISPNNYRTHYWTPLLEEAGLDDQGLTPHLLRHTFASQQLLKNVSLATLSYWLGHANPRVTMAIYAHPLDEATKQVASLDYS